MSKHEEDCGHLSDLLFGLWRFRRSYFTNPPRTRNTCLSFESRQANVPYKASGVL